MQPGVVSLPRPRQWQLVPLITGTVVLFFLLISYFTPANMNWLSSSAFSWSNLLRFVVVDQFLVELITFFILARLISVYKRIFHLRLPSGGLQPWIQYLLRFVPLFLLAFFLINPATQSVRYLLHCLQGASPDYWRDYFYSTRLYLIYLTPLTMGGILLVILDVYFVPHNNTDTSEKMTTLPVTDANGKTRLPLQEICYLEMKDRKVWAVTAQSAYRVPYSLAELEEMLANAHFVRVNRGAIVNLAYFKNYSFWENDKYIVRLADHKEFIVSRDRLKKIKPVLES